MKKVDLSSLNNQRRKKGRKAQHNPEAIAEISTLNHGEGWIYAEADMNSEAFSAEMKKALPIIKKNTPDNDEAVAVFENRWISRYRQRAVSLWKSAGLPADEFDFAVLNDGKIIVGRK